MIENLLPLNIPPGFHANGTIYQSAGRWRGGNNVRFHEGTIQPIGGWQRSNTTGAAIVGTAQEAISWQLADGTPLFAVGTTDGLYVIDDNDVVYNITPTAIQAPPFNWQLSIFGSYLIATNGLLGDEDISLVNVFKWTGDTSAVAVPAWTYAVGPRGAYSTFATPERFLVVLRGEDPTSAPAPVGVGSPYSERRVYWPSQEELEEFVSTDTNTGGWFDLTTDGRLICGAAGRGQSLIWTDVDLWTMNYIGGELVYSFANAGRQCGTVSKRAHVVLDKGAYWMGRDKFFVYDGFVRNVPCEVSDAVFGDFNKARAYMVWATVTPQFNEVTWFYPSRGSLTPNRYVSFNYEEDHWTFGVLQRSAGVPRRFRRDVINEPVPVMFDGSAMYNHETGNEREAQGYVISGPIELGTGDRLMRIQGIVPDDRTAGDVALRLYTSMSPDGLETVRGPYTLQAVTPLRATARQCRVRLDETGATDWRVGNLRLAVLPGERRGPSTSGVQDLTPASIEVIPDAITLVSAQHYTFTAIVRNAAGEVLDIAPDFWTSDAPASVSINDTGTVTALQAPSVAHITASLNSPALTSNVATVTIAPRTPASITIESAVTLEQIDTHQLTAVVRDVFGVVLTDHPINTWTSSDAAKATVSGAGLLTGVGASGSCNVTASITTPPLTSNVCAVTCTLHWVIHQFTINDTFNVTAAGGGDWLLAAGGGSGGSCDGSGVGAGGGGGGGVVFQSGHIDVGSYPVVIGGGGIRNIADHTIAGGVFGCVPGSNGSNSSFMGKTALGGGGGGGSDATLKRAGRAGGSGGGGASAGDGAPAPHDFDGGASLDNTQGNDGCPGVNTPSDVGGGGGGAGGGGSLGTGGLGFLTDINNASGTFVRLAAGGGAKNGPGANGTANSGNGGEGGGQQLNAQGGNGGSGVLYVKYKLGSTLRATGGSKVILP